MTNVAIGVEEITEITQEIWSSYLDPDQVSPLLPADADGATEVSAVVSVTGAWRGHVVVACSATASRQVAAALMGMRPAT
jgi:chemotaxis protein CheX